MKSYSIGGTKVGNNLTCSCSKLTANIFYNLLLNAMINRLKPGDNYHSEINKLSQTHLFYDLNILTNTFHSDMGNFQELYYKGRLNGSIKNAASEFKSGKFKKQRSSIYNFNNRKIVDLFSEQVKNDYPKALAKATEFSHRYFGNKESSKNTDLIKTTISLILNDTNIKENQVFYICSDGSTKTKAELRKIDCIEFEPFILGVWHYLISSKCLQEPIGKNFIASGKYCKIDIELIYINTNYQNIKFQKKVPGKYSPRFKQTENINNNKSFKVNCRDSINTKSIHHFDDKCDDMLSMCSQQESFYPTAIDQNTDIISILENNDITLSRSIFFYLLTQSIKTINQKRNKNVVEKLFLDLLNITVENNCSIDFNNSYVRYCHNEFKYLKTISSADCLNDKEQINKFSDNIFNNYQDMLYEIIRIRKKYFRSNKLNEAFVVEIIEFIKNDNSIEADQRFYVCSDGYYLTKEQLCDIEELEFEPFVLGIWHYVISQLDSKDAADEHTFDTVFKLSYTYNGKKCERYRLGDIIYEQSDMYVELYYLEE